MMMPGRSYTAGSGYRYGFNGKEQDNEISGQGNQYDYGFRIYNPRLGRFLSVDPLTQSYPWYTPYQFAGNMPIWATDVDGLEELKATKKVKIFAISASGRALSDGETFTENFGGKPVIRVVGTTIIQQGEPGGLEEIQHIDIVLGISRTQWIEKGISPMPVIHPQKLPDPDPHSKINTVEENEEIEIPGNEEKISWRQGIRISVEEITRIDNFNQKLNIKFEEAGKGNPGIKIENEVAARASIKQYSDLLKLNGLNTINLIVGVGGEKGNINYDTELINVPGAKVGEDLADNRAAVIKRLFAEQGIKVGFSTPAYNKPWAVDVYSPTGKKVVTGYMVTKTPVKQKVVNGKATGNIISTGKSKTTPSSTKPKAGTTF